MEKAERKSFGIWAVLILAGLCAIYLPGLDNELVFDDQILSNGYVWEHYGSLAEIRQRMLSYGSFVWLEALFGDGWWKQRLFNLALHFAVILSLYAFLRTLLVHMDWPEELRGEAHFAQSRTAALQVGLALFAFNPVAVYAVAYLIQRSILGATLFVVLACLFFVKGLIASRPPWHVAALASYVLALLCKEHALMAPALAIPLYIFVKRPDWRKIVLIVGGTSALVAAVVATLLTVYGRIIGVPFDELSVIYVEQLKALEPDIEARAWPLSVLNQSALFFYYGFLWFVPNIQWMSVDLRPAFPLSLASWPQLAGAFAYVALLVAAIWLVLKRSGPASLAGLCLLMPALLFATEFATVWIQDPFVLYRSYLWAIAMPGLVVLLLTGLRPGTIYALGVVVAVGFGTLAFERVLSFKDTLSVWSDAVEKVDLAAADNAVGRWRPYLNRGSHYLERAIPDLAYRDFARADALGELQGTASFNMGVSLQLMGKHREALDALRLAEQRGFRDAGVYYHRAQSEQALGQFGAAVEDYSHALAQTTDDEMIEHVRSKRAEVALRAGAYELAREDYEALVALEPGDYRSRLGLAMAFVGLRDGAAALPHFDALLAEKAHPSVHYGRALALRLLRREGDALAEIDRAIALDPQNPVYRNLRSHITGQH